MGLNVSLKAGSPRKSDLLVGFAVQSLPADGDESEESVATSLLGDFWPEGIHDVSAATNFKAGRLSQLHVHGRSNEAAAHFLVIGLGKPGNLDAETFRKIGGNIAVAARKHSVGSIDVALWPLDFEGAGIGEEAVIEALCEGLLLGAYQYNLKSGSKKPESPKNASVYVEKVNAPQRNALHRAEQTAVGVFVARDLINMPGNYAIPKTLAEYAQKLAPDAGKKGAKKAAAGDVKVTVFEKAELQKMGMGGLLAVNQGSVNPPFLICMEYKSGKKGAPTIGFVGKGITFDTGGYNLKVGTGMSGMKHDMAGAGAVIGLMHAVAQHKPGVNVVGIVPTTENMISGSAYKMDDVLTMYNGKTVEVQNTDAEGRLVLADALAYACKQYKPEVLVDYATLTGACVVALGKVCGAVMSPDDALADDLVKAGTTTGERVWRLPLWDEYGKQLDSKIADMKNVGGREGGAITAGYFLSHFVDTDKVRWAHVDIAGVAWNNADAHYTPYGATAFGVRLGLQLIAQFEAADSA